MVALSNTIPPALEVLSDQGEVTVAFHRTGMKDEYDNVLYVARDDNGDGWVKFGFNGRTVKLGRNYRDIAEVRDAANAEYGKKRA